MNQDAKVIKIASDFVTPSKIQGRPYFAYENNASIQYLYAPFDTLNVMYVKYLGEKYWNMTNVDVLVRKLMIRITDTDTIAEVVPSADVEDGYYLWAYNVPNSITGMNNSGADMGLRISFIRTQLEEPDEYLGATTTEETVDATINAELKVSYDQTTAAGSFVVDSSYTISVAGTTDFTLIGAADSVPGTIFTATGVGTGTGTAALSSLTGNFINVYEVTSGLYDSWLWDGVDWERQDDVINEVIQGETDYYTDTLKATSFAGGETTDRDITDDIVAEQAAHQVLLDGLTGSVGDLMAIADYDTEGTATDDVKFARNMHTSTGVNDVTALEAATAVTDSLASKVITDKITVTVGLDVTGDIQLNQDLETTDSPTFVAVTAPTVNVDTVDFGTYNLTENTTAGTLDLELANGVVIQVGQEMNQLMTNKSGGELTDMTPVWVSGVTGNKLNIDEIDISVDAEASRTIGVITQPTIADNAEGYVSIFGFVRDVDSSGFTDDDDLWVSDSGGLTATKPEAPLNAIKIGVVVYAHATQGVIFVGVHILPKLQQLSDVYAPTMIDGDMLVWNHSNLRFEIANLNNYSFSKTGWPVDVDVAITISFVNGTRTFSLAKTIEDVDYWIENVKYTLSTTKNVVITDTEGIWFIYLVGDTLTASQTAWDLRANDKCLVAALNWDATNNEAVTIAFEGHSYEMSGVDHYDSHFGIGTTHINGLAVSESVAGDTLDVTAGKVVDEDILIQVVDDDTPTAYWEQPLTPLKSYKYYRDGANGDFRRADDSTSPFYLDTNVVQLNPFGGGVWSLTDLTLNKFGAYWVLYTSDITNPIKMLLGQAEGTDLNAAQEANTLATLDLGSIPLQEIMIAYRVIVKRIVASPYYEITQIDNFLVDPVTGIPVNTPSSHGALTGLLDNDHTQYPLSTVLAAVGGAALIGNTAAGDIVATTVQAAIDELDGEKVAQDLSNDTNYPVATAAGISDDTLTEVFIDDDGTAKKITLNEIYVGANAATGAFVASGDYRADGLTAYNAAQIVYHDVTLVGTGQYKCDIKTQETDHIIYILFPAISSNTNDLELSTDDGSNFFDVLVNGDNVMAEVFDAKLVRFQFDGTNFIADIEALLAQEITYDEVIDSSFGVVSPIKGSPQLNEVLGLTLNQIVINGNFDDSTTNWVPEVATIAESGEILSITGNGASTVARAINDTGVGSVIGNLVFVKVRARVTNSDALTITIRIDGSTGGTDQTVIQSTPTINQWYNITGILTLPANITGDVVIKLDHTYADAGTQDGKVMEVDYAMAIDITNTPLASKTAVQMNAIVPEYIEGVVSITDFELQSIGVNQFKTLAQDETGSISGSDTDYTLNEWKVNTTGSVAVSGGVITYSTADTGNLVATRKKFIIGEDYVFSIKETGITGTMRIHIDGVSIGNMTLSGGIHSIAFTATNAKHDIMYRLNASSAGTKTYEEAQMEIKSAIPASTYEAYNSDTQKITADILSVGTSVRDKLYPSNGNWWKDKYVAIDTTVMAAVTTWTIADILTNTHIFEKDLTGSFDYVTPSADTVTPDILVIVDGVTFIVDTEANNLTGDVENVVSITTTGLFQFRVNKTTFADTSAWETELALGTTFIYELETIITAEVESDGGLICEPTTTLVQLNNFGTEFDLLYPLNSKKQIGINTDRLNYIQDEVDDLEVIANASKVVTDLITITEAFSADKAAEYTEIAGFYTVDDATTKPAANVTTTAEVGDFDAIRLILYVGGTHHNEQIIDVQFYDSGTSEALVRFMWLGSDLTTTAQVEYMFRLERTSATTLTAYYGRAITTTYGSPANVVSAAETTIRIRRIFGVKYT